MLFCFLSAGDTRCPSVLCCPRPTPRLSSNKINASSSAKIKKEVEKSNTECLRFAGYALDVELAYRCCDSIFTKNRDGASRIVVDMEEGWMIALECFCEMRGIILGDCRAANQRGYGS